MTSFAQQGVRCLVMAKQRGLVLFFALIALVAMSLAAVALIRSVDTSTIIAGNLAFRQSATTSADAGVEAAINWLSAIQAANVAVNVLNDAGHPFNITNLAVRPGYHSWVDPTLDLTNDATWDDLNDVRLTWDNLGNVKTDGSGAVLTDSSGNTIRYIIQRMCRTNNQPVQSADCLFNDGAEDANGQQVRLPQEICNGAGCPAAGQSPMMRVTARVNGPRNTVSYVQAFVY